MNTTISQHPVALTGTTQLKPALNILTLVVLGLCLAYLAISPLTEVFQDRSTAILAAITALTTSTLCAHYAGKTWRIHRTAAILLITATALTGAALTAAWLLAPHLRIETSFTPYETVTPLPARAYIATVFYTLLYIATHILTTALTFFTTKNRNHP